MLAGKLALAAASLALLGLVSFGSVSVGAMTPKDIDIMGRIFGPMWPDEKADKIQELLSRLDDQRTAPASFGGVSPADLLSMVWNGWNVEEWCTRENFVRIRDIYYKVDTITNLGDFGRHHFGKFVEDCTNIYQQTQVLAYCIQISGINAIEGMSPHRVKIPEATAGWSTSKRRKKVKSYIENTVWPNLDNDTKNQLKRHYCPRLYREIENRILTKESVELEEWTRLCRKALDGWPRYFEK
jgi:hypothetical protein